MTTTTPRIEFADILTKANWILLQLDKSENGTGYFERTPLTMAALAFLENQDCTQLHNPDTGMLLRVSKM